MRNSDLAVVVLSCDKFSSLWPLFFKRFDKYFPANFAKVYLLSNHIDLTVESSNSVKVVCVGKDISWSANLRKLLGGISEQNVLLLMDDAPLSQAIEIEKFQFFYNSFIEHKMNYLNLKASPKPSRNIGTHFGEIQPSTAYRTAVVPSLWGKDILLDLLKDNENAWQFEVYGSKRSKRYEGFYAVRKPFIAFDHIVIKGKIDRSIFAKLKNNNEHLGIDFPVMGFWESVGQKINQIISWVASKFLPDRILALLRQIRYGS